ncbi:MAG: carboxylating nicotinate-nucleotide diphosphorylase [Leptospiraceae bacterium]|nr:carboxylating nicotinate-nucleotide diphosphorylase [Leptospiraceae bacterium]
MADPVQWGNQKQTPGLVYGILAGLGLDSKCKRTGAALMSARFQKHYTQPVSQVTRADCQELLQMALAEDAPAGDPAAEALFDPTVISRARLVSREKGVAAGLAVLPFLFELWHTQSGRGVQYQMHCKDGAEFGPGSVLAELQAATVDLLRLERIILNMLQYLSGIASVTATTVALAGDQIAILDTRKTLPGYRRLAKYAVFCGGGSNHRISLSDMAMIKDNHVAAAGGIQAAVTKLRARYPDIPLNVEVDTLDQLAELLELPEQTDVVLLDNMGRAQIDQALQMIQQSGRAIFVELSGGWTPERLTELHGLGNLGISMGFLTHTTRFLDISMELQSDD